ncbi:hypothetical protein C4D60_Mb09t17260 [Musa balbisiana]|uniref:TLC domain-containing protein n=1 Tax=Musa balbisiana TaxID=52838 RepID=A0A4S8IH11_MUSBA|nr:hypothetical protein C4D60_Mb09t17260 [Musa balbisiana]
MDVMEALRWMRWELESYPAYGDFVLLPFFVMLFLDRFLLGVQVFFSKLWLVCSFGWEAPASKLRARSEHKAVYTYAAAFYASSIFALCSGKQDNPISMFAHVGSVVLAIHDASDVFLEVGKMAKDNGSEWLLP